LSGFVSVASVSVVFAGWIGTEIYISLDKVEASSLHLDQKLSVLKLQGRQFPSPSVMTGY
jgi:hypothetical protein